MVIIRSAEITGPFLPEIKNGEKGLTLLELLVVVSILIFLSSTVLISVHKVRERAKVVVAKTEINQYATMLAVVREDVGHYPDQVFEVVNHWPDFPTLKALTETTPPPGSTKGWRGPYLDPEERFDPWGMPYRYELNYEPVMEWGPLIAHLNFNPPPFDFTPAGPGVLIMENVGPDNITANRIWLNGVEIISPSEMVNGYEWVQKNVTFNATGNVLSARLLSKPGSRINIFLSDASHIKYYVLESYGSDKQPGGKNTAKDLKWMAGQFSVGFD